MRDQRLPEFYLWARGGLRGSDTSSIQPGGVLSGRGRRWRGGRSRQCRWRCVARPVGPDVCHTSKVPDRSGEGVQGERKGDLVAIRKKSKD